MRAPISVLLSALLVGAAVSADHHDTSSAVGTVRAQAAEPPASRPGAGTDRQPGPAQGPETGATQELEPPPARHPVLFYLPNRLFDVLDVVRARVRLGPGIAVSARATRPASVTLGGYTSAYFGLPGTRGERRRPRLMGAESYAGADIGVLERSAESEYSPGYGPSEVGAGVHLAIVGLDVGVSPLEIVDLVAGLLFLDLRDDDY